MTRMFANVIALLSHWRMVSKKISDTQFGFYPGRNTLQLIFNLKHLRHAAHILKPGVSGRMHTAFIDFKQAYDTIPRQYLWQHLQRTRVPASYLFVHYSRHYDADENILKDGEKTAAEDCCLSVT